MTDFMTFQEELLETTHQAIEYAKQYWEARKQCKKAFNGLQLLIYKAKLHTSRKSPENKILELLASPIFGEEARRLNEEMGVCESQYKGLELVVKAYMAHSSALQSVMKTQVSGEISEAVKNKYQGMYADS